MQPNHVRQQFRRRMLEMGMSQRKAALVSGISNHQINRFLNGRINLSLENLLKFAEALDCDLILTPKVP